MRGGVHGSPRFFVPKSPGKKAGIAPPFSHSQSETLPIKNMSVNIEMPKLSDTMTEGTLIKWHKQVGDTVEIGDILAEVETDKATMEMEAFDDGVITEILIKEGDNAAIGSVLAVLDGDSAGTAPAPSAPAAAPATPAAAAAAPAAVAAGVSQPVAANGDRLKASPLARKVAAETGVNLAGVTGSGPAGRIVKSDVQAAASSPAKPAGSPSSEATAAAALAASIKSKAAAPAATAAPAPPAQAITPVAKEGDERIELSSMRKIIASRLLTSKTTIPHFYLHLEVDAAPLMALRQQVNAQAEKTHGNKYSVNDFILNAGHNILAATFCVQASHLCVACVCANTSRRARAWRLPQKSSTLKRRRAGPPRPAGGSAASSPT